MTEGDDSVTNIITFVRYVTGTHLPGTRFITAEDTDNTSSSKEFVSEQACFSTLIKSVWSHVTILL